MIEESEVLIKDIWPKLCELGIIELRINGYTEWSDTALDPLCIFNDYRDIYDRYIKTAEKMLLEEYDNFRVTDIKIRIVQFHHCVADVEGYWIPYTEEEEVDE